MSAVVWREFGEGAHAPLSAWLTVADCRRFADALAPLIESWIAEEREQWLHALGVARGAANALETVGLHGSADEIRAALSERTS